MPRPATPHLTQASVCRPLPRKRPARAGRSIGPVAPCVTYPAVGAGLLVSGLIFSIVWRSSRPRTSLASLAHASSRSSKSSLPFSSSQTSFSSRSLWMKPRNSDLSKNSGAAGAYSSDRRCAASWHSVSSSPRRQRARAVLHQHRDGDEVALERLLQRVRDRAQAEHLVGLAGAAGEDAAFLVVDLRAAGLRAMNTSMVSRQALGELRPRSTAGTARPA